MHNTKVAILISTMDRPDFLIRTLNYYAKMNSPHPVYVSDSSNPENADIIKSAMERLKERLETHYSWYPPGFDNSAKALTQVQEKYAVVNGDDDYEIPSSLTRCAEFLENNLDYASAGGHGISFRLKSSGPYGEIRRLTDYPNYSLETESAAQRLIDFLRIGFVITFSVNRVEHMKKIWTGPIPLIDTWNELFQVCYCALAGKSKLIDCLGIVRHIHDRQYYQNHLVDWLTGKDFHSSYASFQDHLAKKIMEMDNIPKDHAEKAVKDAFLGYLNTYMAVERKEWRGKNESPKNSSVFKKIRANIGTTLPVLKVAYRRYIRPLISETKQIHYEVTNPRSPYYKDFQAVLDSFTGKDIESI